MRVRREAQAVRRQEILGQLKDAVSRVELELVAERHQEDCVDAASHES
jgi:hypothetical protein